MSEIAVSIGCPGCGATLPAAGACGGACGRSGGCALVCCPACGRSFPHPRRSRLAWWLARWLARRSQAAPAQIRAATLAALPVGTRARVTSLQGGTPAQAQQLAALGLLPGMEVSVRQRRPTLVVELGETTLALEPQVAGGIAVQAT